jgi:hypothetical protein
MGITSQFARNVAVMLVLAIAPAAAWAAPPTLTHLFPAGGQRGAKVTVTCTGSFTWPVKVWAPGLKVVPAKQAGKLNVFIPEDLAADRVWIRLYNSEGASAAAPFLIENLKRSPNKNPTTSRAPPNHLPNLALSLTAS